MSRNRNKNTQLNVKHWIFIVKTNKWLTCSHCSVHSVYAQREQFTGLIGFLVDVQQIVFICNFLRFKIQLYIAKFCKWIENGLSVYWIFSIIFVVVVVAYTHDDIIYSDKWYVFIFICSHLRWTRFQWHCETIPFNFNEQNDMVYAIIALTIHFDKMVKYTRCLLITWTPSANVHRTFSSLIK